MAYKSRVSDAVVRRLPMYYRHLRELEKAGVVRISSQELGERMNLTASQIRQDINCFGGFGQQGYGYHVANLKERIGEILGLNHEYHVIIIGAGNIGRAVANYTGFAKEGFNVQAMFDVSPALVGIDVHGILVQPMEKLTRGWRLIRWILRCWPFRLRMRRRPVTCWFAAVFAQSGILRRSIWCCRKA